MWSCCHVKKLKYTIISRIVKGRQTELTPGMEFNAVYGIVFHVCLYKIVFLL